MPVYTVLTAVMNRQINSPGAVGHTCPTSKETDNNYRKGRESAGNSHPFKAMEKTISESNPDLYGVCVYTYIYMGVCVYYIWPFIAARIYISIYIYIYIYNVYTHLDFKLLLSSHCG